MRSRFLFPHNWRKVGIALFLLGFVISGLNLYFNDPITVWQVEQRLAGKPDFEQLNHGIVLLLWICGLFLIAFSKEKIEDEQIAQLRLDSLQWSTYFNYAVLLLCVIFLDSMHLITMIAAHYIFTPLVFFIIRFRWVVYQMNRAVKTGE